MKHIYLIMILMGMVCVLSCSKKDDGGNVPSPVNTTSYLPTVTSFSPASGKPGTFVTITGTNFGNDFNNVTIKFGNSAAIKPVTVTPTEITVYVPADGSVGPITVTVNNNTPITTSNFTVIGGVDPNYAVKTIGVSFIYLATDKDNKITLAEIFGGGNRVILKAGTGNTMEMVNFGCATDPDAVSSYPDATLTNGPNAVNNSVPITDTLGGSGAVIKLRGFDKSKFGFNQLNLVMQKYVWVKDLSTAGYYDNMQYLTFNKKTGSKNSDYGLDFVKQLFSGSINVSTLEIAPTTSAYITRDQIVSTGICSVNPVTGKTLNLDLYNSMYRMLLTNTVNNYPNNLKFEWVNADNGTVTKLDDYTYKATFSNIKIGGADQVVEPSDTTSKVFLRVSGFNAAQYGYDQLRLFVTNDGSGDGSLKLIYNAKPTVAPSLSALKDAYKAKDNYFQFLSPVWHHF